MEIAIIGNGPSYEEYLNVLNKSNYDILIGCNYPDDRILPYVDYSAFCDSSAARRMRIGGDHHEKLGKFKIVLGKRSEFGLTTVKNKPGGNISCLQYFNDLDLIQDVLCIPSQALSDGAMDEQKYFTSGHLAYQFACEKWPDAEISIYGIDSLFTQNHRDSYSNKTILGLDTIVHPEASNAYVLNKWKYNWQVLFDLYSNHSIFFGPNHSTINREKLYE